MQTKPPVRYYRQDSGENTKVSATEYAKLAAEQRRLTMAGKPPECTALIISRPKPSSP